LYFFLHGAALHLSVEMRHAVSLNLMDFLFVHKSYTSNFKSIVLDLYIYSATNQIFIFVFLFFAWRSLASICRMHHAHQIWHGAALPPFASMVILPV
jgi:hypothetical protein